MWRVLLGFSIGLYFGTYYDFKPSMDKAKKYIKNNIPEKN
tara:strand:- start:298 stop:417 length:120 start_codon:yes stop_codon:yes gene_type:complete